MSAATAARTAAPALVAHPKPAPAPTLRIGSANDPLEAEADRAADAVVRGDRAVVSGGSGNIVRRKCATCEAEDEGQTVRLKRDTGASDAPAAATPGNLGPGRPLSAEQRAYFEPRFGHDLGQVRVHDDERSASSAAAYRALAYTFGQHVVFARNRFDPVSTDGRKLLAHELAHTVQQRSGSGAAPSPDPRGAIETSADRAAHAVLNGGAVALPLPRCGIGISRTPAPVDPDAVKQLEEVKQRLMQPDYPGRDRDLAIKEALEVGLRSDDDEDDPDPAPVATGPPPIRDLITTRRDPRSEYGDRVMKELEDEQKMRKRIEAENEAKANQEADEKSSDDLEALRATLSKHGFSRSQMAALITNLHPRAAAILRHYGLTWPRRGPTQESVESALDKYEFDQRKATTGSSPVMGPVTADMDEQMEKDRILKAQLEGYAATTGSFLGAVSGGVTRHFTDDEEIIAGVAKLGATAEGALTPFAQAVGAKGSYVPDVENRPFEYYNRLRYQAMARAKPSIVEAPTKPQADWRDFLSLAARFRAASDAKYDIHPSMLAMDQGSKTQGAQEATRLPLNEIDPAPLPAGSIFELDYGPSTPGPRTSLNEFDFGPMSQIPALKLYRGNKAQVPGFARPRYQFGQPSEEMGGTFYRFGNTLNAAEITHGVRLDWDPQAGRPRQVSYEITADDAARTGAPTTDRTFRSDPSEWGAQPRDSAFVNSGYERGHLVQREIVKGDPDVELAVDQLTMVVPMAPALNSGGGSLWRASERAALTYARQYGRVSVEVEPIYDPFPARLADGTPIPRAITRRVIAPDGTVLEEASYLNQ